jgi:ABC-2 type transport system ATP-binding protein
LENAIVTENLTKKFGKLTAVDHISLNVKKGEIYGFLGLNGAGKTTTIRMLLGMISPSKGDAYILSKKVKSSANDLWEKVGYLVEIPYSYGELTVYENLEIYRKYHLKNDNQSTLRLLEKFKLKEYKNVKAKNLSSGNNQRLGIAKAMIHDPEILILDEPVNGLDPAGIVEIRQLLLDLSKNQGKTIFISSHILSEISKLADRIGIIHNGKLIKELDEDSLENERKKILKFSTIDNEKAIFLLNERGINAKLDNENICIIEDKNYVDNPEKISLLFCNKNLPLKILISEIEDLEKYFLRIIGFNK